MTVHSARQWIIAASLLVTGATFIFFLAAPSMGYPLTWEHGIRVVEIVLPVFLGYLGSATHFLFQSGKHAKKANPKDPSHLLGLLVRGPIIVFGAASISLMFAFAYSNRASAAPGEGMNIDTLCWAFTALVGTLATTTNVTVSYLFARGERFG